jgi:probable rRNA maturation factor
VGDPASPSGVDASSPIHVVCSDEQSEVPLDASRWERLASDVLAAEGLVGELTVTFVDGTEMRALNAEHMGIDAPTDVLSFPLDAASLDDATTAERLPGVPVLLGDVVVCPAVAASAASDHAGTLDDELALLVVHGILHVLGHDHADADDATRMRARELELLEALHWRGPAPDGFRQEHRDP